MVRVKEFAICNFRIAIVANHEIANCKSKIENKIMISGIIGRKLGMTQLFAEDGTVTPVTVIKAGPCVVVQTKSAAGSDGYNAVQLGLVEDKAIKLKNVSKPLRGIADALRLAENFADGDKIEVVGKSKGRGFAGTIKRHKFARGPESHGSMNVRSPGSIGQSAYPSRVIKGTRSSGHMGDAQVTVKGLTVARVDAENNLLMVRGAVPGANGSLVVVRKS